MGLRRGAGVEEEGRGGERMGVCSAEPARSFGVPGLLSPLLAGVWLGGETGTERVSKVEND